MIIDSHAHIFPPLGGACGFDTVEEHMLFLELYIATHAQPTRRLADHRRSFAGTLGDGRYADPSAFAGADFRVGGYGRFGWTVDGVDYYRQFLPPSLQHMEAPAAFLAQEMAYAGVGVAVLQNARLYGRLNAYFAEASRAFPGKFIPLADVDEAHADTEQECARLRHAVTALGMRGIYYATRGHFVDGYRRGLDDRAFDPYWGTVRELRLPIFWEVLGVPEATPAAYLAQIERLNNWAARFPDIPCVLTHGIEPDFLSTDLPEPLEKLLQRDQFLVEVLYPISQGRTDDYPYPTVQPAIQQLYRRLGGQRLAWGSDMPNVQRHCTYQQSHTYLERTCAFISPSDLERILGDNLVALFRLDG